MEIDTPKNYCHKNKKQKRNNDTFLNSDKMELMDQIEISNAITIALAQRGIDSGTLTFKYFSKKTNTVKYETTSKFCEIRSGDEKLCYTNIKEIMSGLGFISKDLLMFKDVEMTIVILKRSCK